MRTALILIDLQNDYLAAEALEPPAGQIITAAADLLARFRRNGAPVIHVRTTVTRKPDNRMPHWKMNNRWLCVHGTPGHDFPADIQPEDSEPIIDKQFFTGFQGGQLESILRRHRVDTLLLAGVHLHACVRATALDAYSRGFTVLIAESATGSDDPLHAAITRRYLADRAITFWASSLDDLPPFTQENRAASATRLIHKPPGNNDARPWQAKIDTPKTIAARAESLHREWNEHPPTTIRQRATILRRAARLLLERQDQFARIICRDVGKPITMAYGEVRRSAALLHAVADQSHLPQALQTSPLATCRHQPLGVIAAITPWNNPLAIPVGKIAPAFLYGNATLWKPAPAGTMIAWLLHDLWRDAGGDHLDIINGHASAASTLAASPHVAGLTLSGSSRAGTALHEIAARRRIPFQAELGGNNAAIVWNPARLPDALRDVAEGAFGFAGQRCTANRRVILPHAHFDDHLATLIAATAQIPWGPPEEPATRIGPVITAEKAQELTRLCDRARRHALKVIQPHTGKSRQLTLSNPCFFPPTIIVADAPNHEIVQEESFGPILVVQRAADFDEALRLCNGVRQGLAAALFSKEKKLQHRFLREAHAGILKINQSTADADALSPFGGWKSSGIGPAEHGIADREFFTRLQTLYLPPA